MREGSPSLIGNSFKRGAVHHFLHEFTELKRIYVNEDYVITLISFLIVYCYS